VLLPGFASPVKLGIRVRIAAGAMTVVQNRTAGSLGCTLPAREDHDADGSLTVTVVPGQRLDRDFILRWGIAADTVATTTLLVEPDAVRPAGLGTGKPAEEAPGDGTFSLVIVPPSKVTAGKQSPRDVVFVLDRSGSMGGWQMVAARRAVARMVDTLSAEDRVSVLAFDDSVEHCGDTPHLAPATDRHRWSVLEWLGGIEARGGTDLAAAIKAGFGVFAGQGKAASTAAAHRDRVFVLVTDCQVGDEDRVIANLVSEIGDVTLFVVGIDTAVNEGLLSRMADSTGGMVEMVESEDRLDEAMERIHLRLAAPLVSDLDIQSAGLDIVPESLVPAKLPNLVPGVPVVVRGRYRGRPTGGICIEGYRPSGDAWREHAEATAVSTGCQGSLWARGRLRHLEDRYAACHDPSELELLEKSSVDLSTAFGVLCRFTAIVAIDPRDPDRRLVAKKLRRIVQPVETELGMHAMRGGCLPLYCLEDPPSVRDYQARVDYFLFEGSSTPLEALSMEAAAILAKARPKSGAIAAMKAGRIRSLLKAVLALLKKLGACGAPRETIESLATAYGRLYAMPADRDAIVAMLDAVSQIAGPFSTRDGWWSLPPRGASLPSN
jgi:Ca-activated chloride channel family protein